MEVEMILPIVQVGNAVLRARARSLSESEIRSKPIQDLIEQMRETMRDAPGVGLAAPQIGEPLQLVVIEDRPEYLKSVTPERLAMLERRAVPFHVLVNPRLTRKDAGEARFFEGCLSFAGFVGIVPRALEVHVDALDERGEPVSIDARGWYARILQHEVDHLDGVVCIDRMYTRTLTTQENYGAHLGRLTLDEIWSQVEPEREP
jgi:peptide deformylase